MANEVEIVVRGKDLTGAAMNSAAKNTKGYAKGLESVGEASDKSEQRVMGMKDSVDGLATIMKGPGEQGLASYLQGWADLASGIANFVIPAMQAFTIANIKAAAGTVATKVAAIATATATKAWAAAQWLLNVALTANPIGLVIVAIAALVGGLILAYKKSETFRNIVNAVGQALGKMAKWIWDKVVAVFKVLFGWLGKIWGAFKDLIGANDDAKKAAEENADAQQELAEKIEEATIRYQDQIDAMNLLADTAMNLVDGEAGLEDAIDKVTESVKKNGKTVDIHTDKGRNNRKALNDIVRSTLTWRDASIKAGESTATQARITEKGRAALIKAARQMGMSEQAAKDYADQLFGIPAKQETDIFLRTPNLEAVRRSINVFLRDRVLQVYVTTTKSQAVRDNDKRTGGVVSAAATGGVRSRRTLVGENGPEILDMPAGSMVRSNPDTRRILSEAGGGGGLLQIEWVGGNAGDEFMSWLKKNIRVRAGTGPDSVQRALGY